MKDKPQTLDIVTSTDIKRTLDYITRGKTRSIQELRSIIYRKFDEVMNCIESDGDMVNFVLQFNVYDKLEWGQVRLFRNFLKQRFLEIITVDDTVDEFGNESLFELGTKIRDLHLEPWFSSENIGNFTKNGIDFVDAFLSFYNDDGNTDTEEGGGVKTKTKKHGDNPEVSQERDNSEEWFDDEDERWNGFLNDGDVVTLRILFSCIKSYLKSLKRQGEEIGLLELLNNKTNRNIWDALSPLVQKLKLITHMPEIRRSLESKNEYTLNGDMPTIIQSWEAFAIMFASQNK